MGTIYQELETAHNVYHVNRRTAQYAQMQQHAQLAHRDSSNRMVDANHAHLGVQFVMCRPAQIVTMAIT